MPALARGCSAIRVFGKEKAVRMAFKKVLPGSKIGLDEVAHERWKAERRKEALEVLEKVRAARDKK